MRPGHPDHRAYRVTLGDFVLDPDVEIRKRLQHLPDEVLGDLPIRAWPGAGVCSTKSSASNSSIASTL
jgi:hypothetical protein